MSESVHASVGMMGRLLDWFRGSRGKPPSGFPALIRVRDPSGAVVPRVHLTGVFEPIGRRIDKNQPTAAGLCMVTWPRNAERLVLTIRVDDGEATLELIEPRPDPSRVIEIRLEKLASAKPQRENSDVMVSATAGTCAPAVP